MSRVWMVVFATAAACSSADIDLDAAVDGAADARVDTRVYDGGVQDSSTPDTGVGDTGAADTGAGDTATGDTGVMDGAPGDTGSPDAPDAPDGGAPGVGALVISEIMPDSDAVGDALGEWFELHNPDATLSYSLDGCTFFDGGGTTETPTGVVIAPGDYVAFAISATPGFTPDYVYRSDLKLANPPDPDTLTIQCGADIVDSVTYLPYEMATDTWPWGQGESLNLDPAHLDVADNDLVTSWCAGTTVYNILGGDADRGTPGEPNVTCP